MADSSIGGYRTTASAIPDSLKFSKPRAIVDGIRQEQLAIMNQNTITSPTGAGSEIQFWMPQLSNTFWDCETAYFVFHALATFQEVSNAQSSQTLTTYANDCNGAFIGGFYSCFQRYCVWANGLNQTDDINEVGIVAIRVLNITMTKQAREAMSFMFGFQMDPFSTAALAGYRLKGIFPYSADSDSAILLNQNGSAVPGGQEGAGLPSAYFFNQNFDFAIPVIGTLGANNPNLYYMGLGNTKISLFTDSPTNFLLLPPGSYDTRYIPVNASATAPNTQAATISSGGLSLVSWTITRARMVANTIILSQEVMERVMSMTGTQIVSLCQSFSLSQTSLSQGVSGLQQVILSNRKGSMNYVIATFNNSGTSNAQYNGSSFLTSTGSGQQGWSNTATGGFTTTVAEISNFFNKYGSINPGLGQGTNLSVNNTTYPKNGTLNPTQYPAETLAFMAECMNMYSNSDQKWAPPQQNWCVADPAVVAAGLTTGNFPSATATSSTQISQFWRSGAIMNGMNSLTVNGTASCCTSPFFKWCFVAPETLMFSAAWNGQQKYTYSNDFFLFFGLQDQSRRGMISGKNTMDGSNFLNMNLVVPTSYAYNIYFICNFDCLIVHDFVNRNVYPII